MTVRVCAEPGCPELTLETRCIVHHKAKRKANDQRRPSAGQRGYGAAWRAVRVRFLAANPTCCLCGAPAEVPDHYPVKRRDLIAQGVADPDAPERLRPLCTPCHNRETASDAAAERVGRRSRETARGDDSETVGHPH